MATTRGPFGWENWNAAVNGRQARATSQTASALLVPLWQEFGIYSHASFTGGLELGPIHISPAFPAGATRVGNAQMTLVMRVTNHLDDPDINAAGTWETDTSAYHGGTVDDEFSSLLSLALGRRLRSGGTIRHRMSGHPEAGQTFYGHHQPPQLASPQYKTILPGIAKAAKNSTHKLAVRAWNADHGDPRDHTEFSAQIAPALRTVPIVDLVQATGLSTHYSSLIRLGKRTPHERHRDALASVAGPRSQKSMLGGTQSAARPLLG